ncbi:alpha/beta hydrolase [Streptomyces sp. NBC_00989]|uniref:alpha/beta hydrolase n=1 Tax=Streptomyces sp. NBC_00989 TaxID=2903705 RepID=UPI00386AA20D|nr:alpha/beta hydrolase family protein [Streptomyces sp. NBC_00989]
MDLATLKALKPTEYSEAADGYRSTSDMASAAKDRIENQIAVAMRNSLKGEAATAAVKQLMELGKNFHYVQVECGLVSTALEAFSYEMGAAKSKLDAALDGAAAVKLTVNSDGSVTYPPGGQKGEDGKIPEGGTVSGLTDATASAVGRQAANFDPNPQHRLAQDYADRIADALKEATEADAKWAPKLRVLKADDDLTVSDKDWADASSDTKGVTEAGKKYLDSLPQPPKNGNTKDNAEWWKGLTAEEQTAWISMRPDSVGAIDGLPATVRDEANRTVLAEAHGVAQGEYDTWLKQHPEPSPRYQPYIDPFTGTIMKSISVETQEWKDWEESRKSAHKSLDGMDAIQQRFDATGTNGLPDAYLLGFSTEGDGRAIVANGNPDTADHTAVYVPGTTAELGNIDGNMNRMANVWHTANDAADGKAVSTITWLGYDAPDSVVKDAPFEHYAYDGAPAFRNFMDGLDTSHSGDSPAHTTVIAHSYGTTLVGAAAETGHLNADDVVFAGSPGVKVSGADEMDVPKGHVWNEEAEGDPVPDLGRWGHGGDRFIIPSDPHFGANQMTTDTDGHSGYWDANSESLKNQALVVVGKGDDVALKPPPDPWAHVK